MNDALKKAIDGWFKTNASKLGAKAGKARAAGAGNILDALKGLHRP